MDDRLTLLIIGSFAAIKTQAALNTLAFTILIHVTEGGSATCPVTHSGDYTLGETLVPIPNTTVKSQRPMIVPTSAKVGDCRIFFTSLSEGGFFMR